MRWILIGSLLTWATVGCAPQQSGSSATKPPPAADQAVQKAAEKQTERIKAGVGVGKSGRRLDNPELVQPIIQPARTYFRTRERVVFEIQIPHAVNLYKATTGSAPQTHEEFMNRIIKANNINLPELPQGHRYVYDPEQGQLMVERPAGGR